MTTIFSILVPPVMQNNFIVSIVVNLYLAWDLSCDEALLRYVAVGQ